MQTAMDPDPDYVSFPALGLRRKLSLLLLANTRRAHKATTKMGNERRRMVQLVGWPSTHLHA